MKRTNCRGCGQQTPHLIVRYCTRCIDDMVRIMRGRPL